MLLKSNPSADFNAGLTFSIKPKTRNANRLLFEEGEGLEYYETQIDEMRHEAIQLRA